MTTPNSPDQHDAGSGKRKQLRGFAAMPASRQREIASLGGRAAHQSGHAHEFATEEAREAGRRRHQLQNSRRPNAANDSQPTAGSSASE